MTTMEISNFFHPCIVSQLDFAVGNLLSMNTSTSPTIEYANNIRPKPPSKALSFSVNGEAAIIITAGIPARILLFADFCERGLAGGAAFHLIRPPTKIIIAATTNIITLIGGPIIIAIKRNKNPPQILDFHYFYCFSLLPC